MNDQATRLAAIDVGTNTVRLLVADRDRDNRIGPAIARQMTMPRLGEGVDQHTILQTEPMRRAAHAISDYVRVARDLGATRIRIAATSAVRDAANRESFCALVAEQTGEHVEVLSGAQEAQTAFAGAASAFDPAILKVICDIGGGSTELVAGSLNVEAALSVDVGGVRLTERHIFSDPPTDDEIAKVRADADQHLARAAATVKPVLGGDGAFTFIGVAGTCTTLAALWLDLAVYDPARVHGTAVPRSGVADVRQRLVLLSTAQRRAVPVIGHGRADVIVAGALILEAAMDAVSAPAVTVSERDILDGILAGISLP